MQRLQRPPFQLVRQGVQLRALSTQPPPPSTPPPNTAKYAGHPGSADQPPPSTSPPTRLPSKLQTYAPRLHALSARTGVPLSSLAVSFLVLHELTAVVPVVGFYYLFSMLGAGAGIVGWLVSESETKPTTSCEGDSEEASGWRGMLHRWYVEGTTRAERVGRRYGILGYEKGSAVGSGGVGAAGAVADAVAAYVVVKALLPLRIAFSLAAAPGFARIALRPFQRFRKRI